MASTATYGAPRTLRAVSTPSQRRTASALHPPFASSCCPAQRGAQDLPIGGGTAAAVLAPGIGDRPRPRSEGTRGGTRPAPAAGPFAPRRRITRFKAELCALSPSLPLEAKGSNPRSPRAMPSAFMGRRRGHALYYAAALCSASHASAAPPPDLAQTS
jgi:hypothetical protein